MPLGSENDIVYDPSEKAALRSFTGQRISLLPPLDEHLDSPGMTKS